MIKASAIKANGAAMVILGLSRENTTRLHDGQPILVNARNIDPRLPDVDIAIVAGETEEAIAADLRAAPIRMPPE